MKRAAMTRAVMTRKMISMLVFAVVLNITRVSGNIIFNHVSLSCDPNLESYTGCLRGQTCLDDGSYVLIREKMPELFVG